MKSTAYRPSGCGWKVDPTKEMRPRKGDETLRGSTLIWQG